LHIDRPLVAASAAARFSLAGCDQQATMFDVTLKSDGRATPLAGSHDLRGTTKN
jgi:hypothetical protein